MVKNGMQTILLALVNLVMNGMEDIAQYLTLVLTAEYGVHNTTTVSVLTTIIGLVMHVSQCLNVQEDNISIQLLTNVSVFQTSNGMVELVSNVIMAVHGM